MLINACVKKVIMKCIFVIFYEYINLFEISLILPKMFTVNSYSESELRFCQCSNVVHGTEAYSKPCEISKMERLVKIIYGQKPLTIFPKRSILDNRG